MTLFLLGFASGVGAGAVGWFMFGAWPNRDEWRHR